MVGKKNYCMCAIYLHGMQNNGVTFHFLQQCADVDQLLQSNCIMLFVVFCYFHTVMMIYVWVEHGHSFKNRGM